MPILGPILKCTFQEHLARDQSSSDNGDMRLIGYARASTDDQEITLDAQPDKMRGYAELYEHEIVEMIVEAESASSLNRPGIQRALAMMKAGQADGLLVVKLDRLTREQGDWQFLIKNYFCERAGKQLFSVNDYIDTRTATGRMILNMQITIAQWERETIGERTKAALQHKISKNERVGSIRYGYDLTDDGKMLSANSAEQATIQLMRQWHETGCSYREIAAELNGRQIRSKKGKLWSASAVYYILKRQPSEAA
jgi:DNA invertase Pin-like site-specific DNA recombinase